MYAVIFRAEINELDESYSEKAAELRRLAINSYGCTEFTVACEGGYEIAISYWDNLDQIEKWKQDVCHLAAQKTGALKWYKGYHVQIVEIIREYGTA